jgi:hypothetical protein
MASTANKAIGTKADASALSSLQNTVTQQGEDVAANTNNITALSNQVVNGKQATGSPHLQVPACQRRHRTDV